MNKRKSGIDIIKVVAIILVPSLHWFLNYGFFEVPYVGIDKIFLVMIRYISMTCIGLFVMSTGFLQCNKEPEWEYFKKIARYVFLYVIYSVIICVTFSKIEEINLKVVIKYITSFPGYTWYMAFFFGFYLFIPYLNMLFKNMNKKDFEKFLLILILVIAVPEFVNGVPSFAADREEKLFLLPNWWKEFFPIVFYSLGVYFRRFEPRINKKKAFVCLLFVPGFFALAGYWMARGTETPILLGGGYGNAIYVLIAVCVFGIFYDVEIKNKNSNRMLVFVGKLTLSIYLGLMTSDKYTSLIIQKKFADGFANKSDILYFIEVPLNFFLSLLLAVVVEVFCVLCQKILIKLKTRSSITI